MAHWFVDIYIFKTIPDPKDSSKYYFRLIATSLRQNKDYVKVYMNWFYMTFMYCLPFSILFLVNFKIAFTIRKAKKQRLRFLSSTEKKVRIFCH